MRDVLELRRSARASLYDLFQDCMERTKSAPFGLAGGSPGGPGRVAVIGPDDAQRELVSKGAFTAPPDARIVLRAPGSGGFGPPSARDPARLREDVIDGYVSLDAAFSEYGYRDRAALRCPACDARQEVSDERQ